MSDVAVVETQLVPLGDLRSYGQNPRQGDVGVIVESLREHGQYRALVVQRASMRVLAGNHTLAALAESGASEALVHLVDVDDAEAERIMLVDNRANDLATNDEPMLAGILRDIVELRGPSGLLGTGYDGDDLDELLKSFSLPDAGDAETDDAAAVCAVVIECESEAQQRELIDRLSAEGFSCRALI